MSTINDSLSRIGELMGSPMQNCPPLHVRYGALIRHMQHRHNQLNNTKESWFYSTEQLTVAANTDTYTLTSTNIGKILSVITYSTDEGHFEQSIPFFQTQNLAFDWDLPRNAASGFWQTDANSTHSAMRIAFYHNAGTSTMKAIIRPVPMAAGTYTILFSIGDWASSAAFSDSPLLSQWHSMFEISASIALLPDARWAGLTEDQNIIKRREYDNARSRELALMTPTWDEAILSTVEDRMTFRQSAYSG